MTKKVIFGGVGIVVLLLGAAIFINRDNLIARFFEPNESSIQAGEPVTSKPQIIADQVVVPWGIAELPGGDLLVTERAGLIKRIGDNQQSFPVDGVESTSEGGLLGIALDPEFADNSWLYVYLTYRTEAGLFNRVVRYTYQSDRLAERAVIFEGIPGSAIHDGGRIAFGPDGMLYIATGDAGNESNAQNTNILAGKILRINKDGSIPSANQFQNAIYSYGHRNPQGLAWDEQGRLWSTEHGRSGLKTGFDELNLIENGANYGWPIIEGSEEREGMRRPVAQSGANETWAPAGLACSDGALYFAGLRGQSLYQARINQDGTVTLRTYLQETYGRLRTTEVTNDGKLLLTTSNTDGRGTPGARDDQILSFDTASFR